jgi:hypothetical protein
MAVRRTDGAPKRVKERQEAALSSAPEAGVCPKPAQQVWRGASGALYTHTISSLLYCPEMPEATYVLLHRDAAGAARVLRVGTLDSKARSLNLARIRQAGATLGANEIHFRVERSSAAERARIAFDIEGALAGNAAQPDAAICGVHQPA